jgi:hypothetical protein
MRLQKASAAGHPRALAALTAAALAIATLVSPCGSGAAVAQGSERGFDPAAWSADYALLKSELEKSYSNLAWFASPQGGVDLPALDRRTKALLAQARSDEDARLAIHDFVLSLHDGHFSELPSLAAAAAEPAAEPAKRDLSHDDPRSACAALGYADKSQVAFSLPFETLPQFKLESDGVNSAFRAGLLTWNGARVGLVRIKNFSMRQYPSACERTWTTSTKRERSGTAFDDLVTDTWFATLAAQLRRFHAERVDILLVDVGSNSGGSDSGEWTPRLLSARPVRSARLLMSAAPVAQAYFDEQIAAIKSAQAADPTAALQAKAQQSLAFFAAAAADLANRHCDMSWVWAEQRPFDPAGCSRLIDVGFASGAIAAMAPADYRDRRAAAKIYWPATVDPWRAAWTGRVYVLTNATSYSAAEMFAAIMQDNAIAKTVGVRTGGDGCGFMEETPPVVLPHSHLRFRMPNCVRLRADGSSEVAGIAPDLPIAALEGESARARAARLLSSIVADANSSVENK